MTASTGQSGNTVLVLHGPNLNLLGRREPGIYGTTTLDQINQALEEAATERGFTVAWLQSNDEGPLIDAIHGHGWTAVGIIINAGAYTHYSYAIRDAIAAVPAPTIEIHLSNTHAREDFRHHSVIAPVVVGTIAGLGASSYILALHYLMDRANLERGEQSE